MITVPLALQDFVRRRGDGTVRRLDDQRRLDAVGVAGVDHALHRRRDQDVAFGFQQPGAVCSKVAAGKPSNVPFCGDPLLDGLDVEPSGLVSAPSRSMIATIFAPSSSDRNLAA